MKKLSQIKESVWSDIQDRSTGEATRKEDGTKVHTYLGVDIVLKDTSCDYDTMINDILDRNASYHDVYSVSILSLKDCNYSLEEIANVRNWKAPYSYMIYDGKHGTSLVATFSSYSEVIDFELDAEFEDSYCEDDYIEICKGVATKLKEVGDSLELVPQKAEAVYSSNKFKYALEYALLLVDEGTTFNWVCDQDFVDGHDWSGEFIVAITKEFPELEETDFIRWTYYDGINIAIPSDSVNNLKNFKKYKEFAQNWFK